MADGPRTPDGPDGTPLPGVSPQRVTAASVRLRLTTWSVVRAVLIVAVAVLGAQLVAAAATPLWWLAIAVVVAAVLLPVTVFLDRWLPTWLAVTVVVVGLLVIVGVVGYRGVTEIANQVGQLSEAARSAAADLQESQRFGAVAREVELNARVSSFFDSLPAGLGGANASATVSAVLSSGGGLVAIGFLTLLLMVSGRRFVAAGLRQIRDEARRDRIASVAGLAYSRTTRYLLLMAARAAVIALVTTAVLSWLGVPAPTALGMWMGASSFIPGIGLVVGSLLVALVAVVASPIAAVLAVPVAVVVEMVDTVMVQGRLERRTVRVGPTVTGVAVLVGLALYGFGGLLVGLWSAIFVVAVLEELRAGADDLPGAVAAVAAP